MKCKKCGREIRPDDVVVTFGLNPTEATHWKCYPVPAPMRYDERRMTDLLDEKRMNGAKGGTEIISPKWTMKDGTKISPKDMGNAHLLNTIFMVLRLAEKKQAEHALGMMNFESDWGVDNLESTRFDHMSVLSFLERYGEKIHLALINEAEKRQLLTRSEIEKGEPSVREKSLILARAIKEEG